MEILGGCLCRATRYRSTAPPIVTRVCWCRVCEAESRPHLIFVRAGTLDDPEIARPAMTIWRSQAPSWACIDAELPSTPAQPPPA